mmetsp:Transcript_16748/g.27551  ORF Transcript_16748/g.27551 Transcript_16748/m.27551 type:complete len:302 (-) Transcript_16748:519-1424(-)
MQLDPLEAPVVRLQDALHALAVRGALVAVDREAVLGDRARLRLRPEAVGGEQLVVVVVLQHGADGGDGAGVGVQPARGVQVVQRVRHAGLPVRAREVDRGHEGHLRAVADVVQEGGHVDHLALLDDEPGRQAAAAAAAGGHDRQRLPLGLGGQQPVHRRVRRAQQLVRPRGPVLPQLHLERPVLVPVDEVLQRGRQPVPDGRLAELDLRAVHGVERAVLRQPCVPKEERGPAGVAHVLGGQEQLHVVVLVGHLLGLAGQLGALVRQALGVGEHRLPGLVVPAHDLRDRGLRPAVEKLGLQV